MLGRGREGCGVRSQGLEGDGMGRGRGDLRHQISLKSGFPLSLLHSETRSDLSEKWTSARWGIRRRFETRRPEELEEELLLPEGWV